MTTGDLLNLNSYIQWLQEGNQNAHFFYTLIVYRTRSNYLSLLEVYYQNPSRMQEASIEYFHTLLTFQPIEISQHTLSLISSLVAPKETSDTTGVSTHKKIRDVPFSMGRNQSLSPHGFLPNFILHARAKSARGVRMRGSPKKSKKEHNSSNIKRIKSYQSPNCTDFV